MIIKRRHNWLNKLDTFTFFDIFRVRAVFYVLFILAANCGDPTDKVSDCIVGEFYDEGSQLCKACPPLAPPKCVGGCSYFSTTNESNCPIAVCLLPDNNGCSCPDEYPDCTPSCEKDEYYSSTENLCKTCQLTCPSGQKRAHNACICVAA